MVLGDQSCPTVCDLMDCNPLSSSVPGVIPTRILERIAFPPPGDLPDPGIKLLRLVSPAFAEEFFHQCATWETQKHIDVFFNGNIFFLPVRILSVMGTSCHWCVRTRIETGWNLRAGTLCCSACTWTNDSLSHKIQINYEGLLSPS